MRRRIWRFLKKRSDVWFFKALGGAKAWCPMETIGLLRRECRSALLARTKNDRFEKSNTAELKTAIYACLFQTSNFLDITLNKHLNQLNQKEKCCSLE
jgi:hypothetical protein